MALFYYWNFNRFQNPFSIYRENLMQLSKIGSKNTYHKCIKQLHEAKYIYYHPAPSRFQVVRISIVRLDKEEEKKTDFKQLNLFAENDDSMSTDFDTGTVPVLGRTSTDFDTGTVSKMGHSYKLNINKQNSVANTPTEIFEKNREINEEINRLAVPEFPLTKGVAFRPGDSSPFSKGSGLAMAKPRDLTEVEAFFTQNQS
jgi:hypothetical protein